MNPGESRVPAGATSLHARTFGEGPPVIVLHGGPDFDHEYLLPDLDRLGDSFRLIYYDQRGRGRSAENVRPEDVSLASELDDLDRVRRHFRIEAPALLGHSWGALLALEYALRHPSRVSRLVLVNPAPMSAGDYATFREEYVRRLGPGLQRQRDIAAGAAYLAGDPEAVTARYRIHFEVALKRPEDHERLMATMKAGFVRQGREGIVKARAVEERLLRETWQLPGYDLVPRLTDLRIPALVVAGEHDFIPVSVAERLARALPEAELVVQDCGHFVSLERPAELRDAMRQHVGRVRRESFGA